MFNFDEAKIRQEHQNGVDIIPQVEKFVDQVCSDGYSNIFCIVCKPDDAHCQAAGFNPSSLH